MCKESMRRLRRASFGPNMMAMIQHRRSSVVGASRQSLLETLPSRMSTLPRMSVLPSGRPSALVRICSSVICSSVILNKLTLHTFLNRYPQNPHVRQRQEFRVLPRQRHRTCRSAQLPCPRHRVCLQSLSFSARPIFFTSHLSSRRRGGVWQNVFDPGKLLRLLHTTHRSRYWIVGKICARPFPEESFSQKVRSRRFIVSTPSRTIVRRP